ncbi:MAG: hypothetical protein OEX19_08140, partial [Gammaproteobacteria bacterium]|nr:hypothetical protein [Gammaproteobacteria bacterium]
NNSSLTCLFHLISARLALSTNAEVIYLTPFYSVHFLLIRLKAIPFNGDKPIMCAHGTFLL